MAKNPPATHSSLSARERLARFWREPRHGVVKLLYGLVGLVVVVIGVVAAWTVLSWLVGQLLASEPFIPEPRATPRGRAPHMPEIWQRLLRTSGWD